MIQQQKTNRDTLFLKELASKEQITKELILLLFKKEGISQGDLFKAKKNIYGSIDKYKGEPSVGVTKIGGSIKKYIKRNRQPNIVSITKGDVGMFIDIECEAVTEKYTFFVIKFLVNQKIVSVAYEILDEEENENEIIVDKKDFSNIDVYSMLSCWKTIKT